MVDQNDKYSEHIVHLARLGLMGDRRNLEMYIRRIMRQARTDNARLVEDLGALLLSAPSEAAPLRDAGAGLVPVDRDTRLQLLRHESPVVIDHAPVLAPNIASALELVIEERSQRTLLAEHDLTPTRTLLFTGRPGVGKTISARWLASRLGKPLLTLDLSTVISSFLGRTGTNLRYVLDYAKSVDSILLLDEFDAIAKRRGDETELGELKRLVAVLLQEIDLWPSDRLLIAATNHGELLDRAVWRRFNMVLEFPLPKQSDLEGLVDLYFGRQADALGEWRPRLATLCRDRSFSDIERLANQIRRRAVVWHVPMEQAIIETFSNEKEHWSLAERRQLSVKLREQGLSDRKIAAMIGVARDTLRKMPGKTTKRSARADQSGE